MSSSIKRKLSKAMAYGGSWIKHRFDVVVLYADWMLLTNNKIRKEISEHDLGKCKVFPYNPRKWHNGTSIFWAETQEGKKYFVKRSLNRNAILAETTLVQKLLDLPKYTNIKVCHLHFVSENKSFLVEEFVNARSLSDKQYVSSMSLSEKLGLLNLLYDLVRELHRRGIIHSDLTPKNILISNEGTPYLIDFEYSLIMSDVTSELPGMAMKSKRKMMALGANYSMRNGIVDDGYSLMAIANYLVPDLLSCDYTLWRKINLLIGQFQYDMNKGMFIENRHRGQSNE